MHTSGEADTPGTLAYERTDPAERITSVEERFERWRRIVGAVLAPVSLLLVYYLLRDSGLTPQGRRLSAILVMASVLWISEALPLPVTALLSASLCILLGVADARSVLAQFANPIIFLFMGSFFLAKAMEIHGLDRRVALRILSVSWIGGRPARVLAAMGLITACISMWVSNTATTAMMVPIALGILAALHEVRVRVGLAAPGPMDARAWPFATGMLLMIAYGASIGGIGTKVGSPPNLITMGAIEKAGLNVSFFEWMKVMVPMVGLMFVALFGLLYVMHPDKRLKKGTVMASAGHAAEPQRDAGAAGVTTLNYATTEAEAESIGLLAYLREQRGRLGPWTSGQFNTLAVFLVAISLWVLPGILQAVLPQNADALKVFSKDGRLPEEIVGLLAGLLLFVMPVNLRKGEMTLSWRQAMTIEWGTLLLFGGGLALGDLMFRTGVAEALGRWATGYAGGAGVWGLTLVMITLGVILSETTSNTAAATMLAPVTVAIAAGMNVSPIAPALGMCLGCSYGFMLPISTAPNAIVFGTGLVPIMRMMRAGVLFDLIGIGVIWVGLRVLLPVMGLA